MVLTFPQAVDLITTHIFDLVFRIGPAQSFVLAIIWQKPVAIGSLHQMAQLVKKQQYPGLFRVWLEASYPGHSSLPEPSLASIERAAGIERYLLEYPVVLFGPRIVNVGRRS